MDREIFLEKIIRENPDVTDKENILIQAMGEIHKYFSEIYNDFRKTKLDQSVFSAGSNGTLNLVSASYKNKGLNFHRESEKIIVKVSKDKFLTSNHITELDTIQLDENNKLISVKYGLTLSEDLLNKYLDILAN